MALPQRDRVCGSANTAFGFGRICAHSLYEPEQSGIPTTMGLQGPQTVRRVHPWRPGAEKPVSDASRALYRPEKRSWLTASRESWRPLLPANGVAMNTRELVSNLAGITGYEIERARPIRIAKAWVRPPRPAHSGPARTDIWPGRSQYDVSLHAEPRVYYLHHRCT